MHQDGSRVSDPEGVKDEVIDYYKILLDAGSGSLYPGRTAFEQVITRKLTDAQQAKIGMEVSLEEIEKAFLSMHPNKALGLDGFNAYFFQRS